MIITNYNCSFCVTYLSVDEVKVAVLKELSVFGEGALFAYDVVAKRSGTVTAMSDVQLLLRPTKNVLEWQTTRRRWFLPRYWLPLNLTIHAFCILDLILLNV